ncbi:MAG: hypothetical protein IIV42_02910, partial [Peptococcaceae bacterium]|nr:hypothetical protein [Peptococcaceae bacterium]
GQGMPQGFGYQQMPQGQGMPQGFGYQQVPQGQAMPNTDAAGAQPGMPPMMGMLMNLLGFFFGASQTDYNYED